MIYLGLKKSEKHELINKLLSEFDFDRVYFISNEIIDFNNPKIEHVGYSDIIEYAFYYRIIENTTKNTLIILNELLRDRNRNNLTFNCIRTFLTSCNHVVVFNYLPIIDNRDDFCSLFDFDTNSRFKYTKFDNLPFKESNIEVRQIDLKIQYENIQLDLVSHEYYKSFKQKLFESFDKKDPDVLPRELQIFAGKFKEKAINNSMRYLLRNKRIKKDNVFTYREAVEGNYIVFDIPFNLLEFTDFLYKTGQSYIPVVITELKIEQFFKNRLDNFINELNYVYSKIL